MKETIQEVNGEKLYFFEVLFAIWSQKEYSKLFTPISKDQLQNLYWL